MYNVTYAKSPLLSVTFDQPVYGQGILHLYFKPDTSESVISFLKDKLKEKFRFHQIFYVMKNLTTTDMDKSRNIVKYLREIGFLSDHDYASLMQEVIKIEKILSQQSKVVDSCTVAQKDVLEFMAGMYLDDVIEKTNQFELALKVIKATLSKKADFIYPYTAVEFGNSLKKDNISVENINSILGTHVKSTAEVGFVTLKRVNIGGGKERIEIRLIDDAKLSV